jgi:hypothetical protein
MVASGEAYREDVFEQIRHKGQIYKNKAEKKKKGVV